MSERTQLQNDILQMDNGTFDEIAVSVFHYQVKNNSLYRKFVELLGIQPSGVSKIEQIPFLPISFFKSHQITTGLWNPDTIFTSSGTTSQQTSQHLFRTVNWYLDICTSIFTRTYGPPADWCFLALLPSYLEREGSSLITMVQHFIQSSRYPESGFFLHDTERLKQRLRDLMENNIPTILLGVSFALLDLADEGKIPLKNTIVMETGGMKGRRKEITREELHHTLSTAFDVPVIHSEYGMTELCSQAYSQGKGIFQAGHTMQIHTADPTDPLTRLKAGQTGTLNIIDLGNLDSCSFIATQDLGKVHSNGTFEVLGRMDNADIRGCNLMVP